MQTMAVSSSVIVLLFSLLTVSYAEIEIKQCNGTESGDISIIKAIRATKCDNQPCTLVKKQDYIIEVDLVPKVAAATMELKIFAKLGTLEMPWIGVPTKVCTNDLGITCPLEANKQVTYKNKIHVQEVYPSIAIPILWKIYLDDKLAVCFLIDVKLEDAAS